MKQRLIEKSKVFSPYIIFVSGYRINYSGQGVRIMEGLHTMINRRDSYTTLEDVISDLGNTSYKEEMMKQSNLFYIVYFWKIMVNDQKVHLEEDSKFREMYLKHPVIRNLGYEYLGIDRSKYLYP